MNQTIKLALGITGVCSILAMLIPQNFSSPQQDGTPTSAIPQPNDVPVTFDAQPSQPQQFQPQQFQQPQQASTQDIAPGYEEEENFSFGDPTASADPIDFNDSFSGNNSSSSNAAPNPAANPDTNGANNPQTANQDSAANAIQQPISNRHIKPQ